MKILITGTSQGIGKAIAELFLQRGHTVIGIDRQPAGMEHAAYTHHQCDVREKDRLPDIEDVDILINNAGTQNEEDIDTNLKALIWITERYGVQPNIKSILNVGSASAHTGSEFPEYCASKGGVLAYTKNVAMRVAQFGATCNGKFYVVPWKRSGRHSVGSYEYNTFALFVCQRSPANILAVGHLLWFGEFLELPGNRT